MNLVAAFFGEHIISLHRDGLPQWSYKRCMENLPSRRPLGNGSGTLWWQ